MNSEDKYYQKIRQKIETKLQWGNSDEWSHNHFKKLSEHIYNETNTLLNHNTLKRFWGRVKYSGGQSISTKDTLTQFLGYKGWTDFLFKEYSIVNEDQIVIQNKLPNSGRSKYFIYAVLALLVIFLALLSIILLSRAKIPDNLEFTCDNMVDYAPHHFELSYKLNGFRHENIEIAPDFLQTQKINTDSGLLSYVYLLPGYAKARLMVAGRTVETIELHTITDGWQIVLAENIDRPFYFKPILNDKGVLLADDSMLSKARIDTDNKFYINYYNVRDFEVNTASFMAETRIRNMGDATLLSTKTVHFGLWGSEGVIDFHVAAKGKTYLIKQQVSDVKLSAKEMDMSAFALEMERWHTLKVVVSEPNVKYYIDDQLVLDQNYGQSLGKLKGIRFRTKGVGEIDYIKLLDENSEIIYSEDFN